MIAYLRGTLEEVAEDSLVLDVNGVGYEVFIPSRLLGQLPTIGGPLQLFTHEYLRDNEHVLFGFGTREERELFRMLIQVSGVGPKSAISLIALMTPKEFLAAVQEGDVTAISRAPGIGKKTAQRLIVDLQAKVGAIRPLVLGTVAEPGVTGEAIQALVALGASEYVAEQAVREARATLGEEAALEPLIAEALRVMNTIGGRG